MLKSVFTIGFNKHQNKILKLYFGKQNVFCYCHEERGEFYYLVNDQKPEVILFDGEFTRDNFETIKSELAKCQANSRKILVRENDFQAGADLTALFSGQISYPLNLDTLLKQLS